MFFFCKRCNKNFLLEFKSLLGVIFIGLKLKEKKKIFKIESSLKSKIYFFMKISDFKKIYHNFGIKSLIKNFYSRNWKELDLLLEIILINHEFFFKSKLNSIIFSTYTVLKPRFTLLNEESIGSGKNFILFLSSLSFLWNSYSKKSLSGINENSLFIALESVESMIQLMSFFSKILPFFGFHKRLRSGSLIGLEIMNCFNILCQFKKSCFNLINEGFFSEKEFKFIIIEVSFFYKNREKNFLHLRNFIEQKKKGEKRLIFADEKSCSHFTNQFDFCLDWTGKFFDSNTFFSLMRFEICKNLYVKLFKFFELFPFSENPLFIFSLDLKISNFLSKIIFFFFLKKLKNPIQRKISPILKKKRIWITSIYYHLLFLKKNFEFFFFEISKREEAFLKKNFDKQDKNFGKLIVFFLDNWGKEFLFNKIVGKLKNKN